MKFEIKHKYSGNVLYQIETDTFSLAIEAAIKNNANLRSANLEFANLESANLRFADLRKTIYENRPPLQIQGSQHLLFSLIQKHRIKIGCYDFTFSEWKKKYKKIGKENGYSDKQIEEYRLYIDLAIQLSKLK